MDRGVAYAYYDPDVLPARVKQWLLIQEPEGRGMSPEEYEHWRAKQSGFPIAGMLIETKKEVAESAHSRDEENVEPPGMDGPFDGCTVMNWRMHVCLIDM